MLGHRLYLSLSKKHEVYGTVRSKESLGDFFDIFQVSQENFISGINGEEIGSVSELIEEIKPDVVINCIGVIKQKSEDRSYIPNIRINSLMPHQLAEVCNEKGVRFIHFSTDCVFDGVKGSYSENDIINANDLYGKSKALGEISYLSNTLTIRTSIIGREIKIGSGLVEWFISQKNGEVKGFSKAIFSGLPTEYFADLLNDVILPNKHLSGLYQISSSPIDKFSLISLINDGLELGIKIERDNDFVIDRSLSSKKFTAETGWIAPPWSELVHWVYKDKKLYQQIKL